MRKGQRTGRSSHIKANEIEDAWNGKFAKPAPNKIFEIVLGVLKRNGEVHTGLVSAKLGCDNRATGGILGAMVKQNIIKEYERRRINGKVVQIYIGFDDKPPVKVKHTERPMCEILAEVEEIAEQSDVCELMIAKSLSVTPKLARDYIERLVRQKVLQKNGKMFIDGTWQIMYGIYVEPPRQQSMMSTPAARDWLVEALFGTANRDSEAAWLFT